MENKKPDAKVIPIEDFFDKKKNPKEYKQSMKLMKAIKKKVEESMDKVLAHREEILRAFVAKYGCGPDQVTMVEKDMIDGSRQWWVAFKSMSESGFTPEDPIFTKSDLKEAYEVKKSDYKDFNDWYQDYLNRLLD